MTYEIKFSSDISAGIEVNPGCYRNHQDYRLSISYLPWGNYLYSTFRA